MPRSRGGKSKSGGSGSTKDIEYYVVFDLECTTPVKGGNREVFQFGAVKINKSTLAVVDTFQRYIKPSNPNWYNSTAKNLFNLSQEVLHKISVAHPYKAVMNEFLQFVNKTGSRSWMAVTWGPTDIRVFLLEQEVITYGKDGQGGARLFRMASPLKYFCDLQEIYGQVTGAGGKKRALLDAVKHFKMDSVLEKAVSEVTGHTKHNAGLDCILTAAVLVSILKLNPNSVKCNTHAIAQKRAPGVSAASDSNLSNDDLVPGSVEKVFHSGRSYYGFISSVQGKLFFHSSVVEGTLAPASGDNVFFKAGPSPNSGSPEKDSRRAESQKAEFVRLDRNPDGSVKNSFLCAACNHQADHQKAFDAHTRGWYHKTKIRSMSTQYDDVIFMTREGPRKAEKGKPQEFEFNIRSLNDFSIKIQSYNLLRGTKNTKIAMVQKVSASHHRVTVVVDCNRFGSDRCFLDVKLSFDGKVVRLLRAVEVTTSNSDVDSLMPTSSYQKKRHKNAVDSNIKNVIRGIPLTGRKLKFKVPLKLHPYVVKTPAERLEQLKNMEKLDLDNYSNRWGAIVHSEEAQMMEDIRFYDIIGTTLKLASGGKSVWLKVDGLAENRPSVVLGDSVYLLGDGLKYEGVVHDVHNEEVLLRLDPKFFTSFVKNKRYDVTFGYNRTTLRRMHQSLALAADKSLIEATFPKQGKRAENREKLMSFQSTQFNPNLNEEQRRAVSVISEMANYDDRAPYVVYGPPGTGKTNTIVEAIKVILSKPDTQVLACAPSNAAADTILERIAGFSIKPISANSKAILRVNAMQRSVAMTPDIVKEFSIIDRSSSPAMFAPPQLEHIISARLVVVTCASAPLLYSCGVTTKSAFSYVFIDEAGHAVEPEAIGSLAGMFAPQTRVVLAGDPQQLGPIVRSPIATKYRLDRSLLERLVDDVDLYKRQPERFADHAGFDPIYVTKLIQNYRSHKAILDIPSRLFYHGDLRVCADAAIANSFLKWNELPNGQFPVVFHAVRGKDMREGNSPSWFNPNEAATVKEYVTKILQKKPRIADKDIGIIAPYRKQVMKIRQLMRASGHDEIKVGSVEEFQGLERRVIIISTVRSSDEYLTEDSKFSLGFVSSPKRFNVAITRAQALLVIVGNPNVLCSDPNWKEFLDHCKSNNAIVHPDLYSPEDKVDVIEDENGDGFVEVSAVQTHTNPEWQNNL